VIDGRTAFILHITVLVIIVFIFVIKRMNWTHARSNPGSVVMERESFVASTRRW
jgi:hypothetical protein